MPVKQNAVNFGGYCPAVFAKAFLLCFFLCFPAAAQRLNFEIQPTWRGRNLELGAEVNSNQVTLTRVDGLLSKLALQKADGTWLESGQWHVFFSVEKKRLTATADGLPAQDFRAIRFLVGLDEKTDKGDPQAWEAGHPLHPNVCGLHWGWQGGYVFLALEGRIGATTNAESGFSYHLARTSQPMWVELPVEFSGKQPATIFLSFDVASVLEGGAVLKEELSTHSRDGDPLAARLKGNVSKSFRVTAVRNDIFQPAASVADLSKAGLVGDAYPLQISDRLPKVKLPADNPLTIQGVELGRTLFNDKRLSRGEAQSCASCHAQANAFSDDREFSVGVDGSKGRRHAMALVNLAWADEFFWDGRARSLRQQALMPIQDAHEMNESLERAVEKLNGDSRYASKFEAAFGAKEISPERIGLALEQYLLSLISQDSKFDRAARKAAELTVEEKRGLQLFVTENDPKRGLRGADCFHCHGGNLFSNHQFMNNGLEVRAGDLGRMEVTKSEADRGKFKVPTLRNIAVTAPYMHDGRFKTLEEVVDHYNGPLHRTATLDPNLAKHPESGLGLTDEDKKALVAFLKTLTDENFISAQSKSLTKNP